MARAALSDHGAAEATLALRELAEIREQDAETGCQKLFRRYALTVDAPITKLALGGDGEVSSLPVVRFSAWVQYLMDHDLIECLTGVPDSEMEARLREFWARYHMLYPDHQLYQLAEAGSVDTSRTIPVYAHVDEGRTYKNKALLILSLHGALGKGTRSYKRRFVRQPHLKRDPMGMNYIGATWGTNFVYGCVLRTVSQQQPEALIRLFSDFATDMTMLATAGVQNSGGRKKLWIQVLGLKADLPALGKAGNFVRNFSRVPKNPLD